VRESINAENFTHLYRGVHLYAKPMFLRISVIMLVYTHQRTGQLTEGIVKRILTNSQNHHRGIKVMLEDNVVGRVQEIKKQ